MTPLLAIRCNHFSRWGRTTLIFSRLANSVSTFSRTVFICGWVGLALVASATPAYADRIDDLSRTLEQEKDEKARIAAAVGLGRLADARAVPALVRALRDSSAVVRGVAASALGRIGDTRAVPGLERLKNDTSDVVRTRAKEALGLIREKEARLSGGGRTVDTSYVAPRERPLLKAPDEPAPTPHLFVTVKSITNKAENGGKPFADKMRDYLVTELKGSPEITMDDALAGGVTSRFVIDGAITSMTKTTNARFVELRCEVQISISNSRGKILSIVTGGATLSVPRASWRDSAEKNLWPQAIENAVRGAHQNLVAYMTRQLATN